MWQAEVRIDLDAIRDNVALMRAGTTAEVMAVVKGDGYGHGMLPSARAALATAGSGDGLAGLLGSLLAGGLSPERAAVAAAYVHGLAGRRAAQDGPVTSPDVAAALRPALAALL